MSVILQSSGSVRLTTGSGLDEIFDSAFEQDRQPGEVRADDPLFFKQDNTEWLAIQYAESQGPGDFTEVTEDEEVPEATVRIGNRTVAEVFDYNRDIPIPERYQESSVHYKTIEDWVMKLGIRARTSRDKFAFRRSYGNAFSTDIATPDGAAPVSNSHTTLNGDTIDNLETGVLNATNLETLVRSLQLQRAQDGDLGSYFADAVLCPRILHPDMIEITKSELQAGTGNNNRNYWSYIYPGMVVGSSVFLDSTYNTLNTNANTSYFVISKMHSITRAVRIPIKREYIDPMYDRRRRAFYRAHYSERTYVGTWGGLVGSNGTV